MSIERFDGLFAAAAKIRTIDVLTPGAVIVQDSNYRAGYRLCRIFALTQEITRASGVRAVTYDVLWRYNSREDDPKISNRPINVLTLATCNDYKLCPMNREQVEAFLAPPPPPPTPEPSEKTERDQSALALEVDESPVEKPHIPIGRFLLQEQRRTNESLCRIEQLLSALLDAWNGGKGAQP